MKNLYTYIVCFILFLGYSYGFSGTQETEKNIYITTGDIFIKEIHAHETAYIGEYILLEATNSYSGSLYLLGALRGSSELLIDIDIKKGEKHLLTDFIGQTDIGTQYTIIPSLTLTNTGEKIVILDENKKVIDAIVYIESEKEKTLRVSGFNNNERLFETTGELSFYPREEPQANNIEQNNNENKNIIDSSIIISEIHPKQTTMYPEYIEIFANKNYSGSLLLHGGGHGRSTIPIAISLLTGQRVILAKEIQGFHSSSHIIPIPNLSLTDKGEKLEVYGQSGHLMDKIVYNNVSDKSLYYSGVSGGFRVFGEENTPTPGVHEYVLGFTTSSKEVKPNCKIQTQNKTQIMFPKTINLIAQINKKDIQNNSSSFTCRRNILGIQTKEWGCNPHPFVFTSPGIHTIDLDIYKNNELYCSLSTNLNYPKVENTPSATINENQSSSTTTEPIYIPYATSVGPFSLVGVLPNPTGKDDGNEGIYIKNNLSTSTNTNNLSFYNGKTKKTIPKQEISSGETVLFTGSWGLKNKASCVSLVYSGGYISPFCYGEAKDGQGVYESLPLNTGLAITQLNEYISSLSLEVYDTQTCILFIDKEIICKNLPLSLSGAKQRKKDTKELVSLKKKFEKQTTENTKRKKKYYEQVERRKEEKESTSSSIKEYKLSIADLRNTLRVYTNFIRSYTSHSKEHRGSFYRDSGLQAYEYVFYAIQDSITKNKEMVDYYGISISMNSIENLYLLYNKTILPLEDVALDSLYTKVLLSTSFEINSFLTELSR